MLLHFILHTAEKIPDFPQEMWFDVFRKRHRHLRKASMMDSMRNIGIKHLVPQHRGTKKIAVPLNLSVFLSLGSL